VTNVLRFLAGQSNSAGAGYVRGPNKHSQAKKKRERFLVEVKRGAMVSDAARAAGLSLRTAYTTLQKHGIDRGPARHAHRSRRALSDEAVVRLRQRLADGELASDLAAELHVKPNTISNIKTGKSYRDVP
jgi:hypothetical protein